jgi:hypothetical protein
LKTAQAVLVYFEKGSFSTEELASADEQRAFKINNAINLKRDLMRA